ncbi:transposase [Alteriqipengyuania sp. 357]
MPLVIKQTTEERAELGDVIEFMHDAKIDTSDEESFAQAGDVLAKLANNREFLANRAVEELEDLCVSQEESNTYSAQVMMLAPPNERSANFFIRANFWPAKEDHIYKTSGPAPFFYHAPHDHNFNFLTVGYHGPGYASDYYEYEYDEVAGYTGEKGGLRFVERSSLHQGKVMLYRAFRDVHDQLPPEQMSISVNICEHSLRGQVLDQYAFDTANDRVSGIINRNTAVGLMPVAAELCGEEGRELLSEIAQTHASDRLRACAIRSLAAAAATSQEARRIIERSADDVSPLVAGLARHRLERISEVEKFRAEIALGA